MNADPLDKFGFAWKGKGFLRYTEETGTNSSTQFYFIDTELTVDQTTTFKLNTTKYIKINT